MVPQADAKSAAAALPGVAAPRLDLTVSGSPAGEAGAIRMARDARRSRACRNQKCEMPMSAKILRLASGAILALAFQFQPAAAFDPAKVFANEKPTFENVFRFFRDARQKGQQEEAIGVLKYAADQGNHAAQWKLGKMYRDGDGVQKDARAAFDFFKKIADSYWDARPGTPDWHVTADAMVALGRYYMAGVPEAGIVRNRNEAQTMFTTAATYFGHPDAQFELARLYLDSGKSHADGIQAARMLKSASDAGHVGAGALLGYMLFEGRYLRRDQVRGLRMMVASQERAIPADRQWIDPMVEEALSVSDEPTRRAVQASN